MQNTHYSPCNTQNGPSLKQKSTGKEGFSLDEVLAMGGTKEDFDMLDGVDSGADDAVVYGAIGDKGQVCAVRRACSTWANRAYGGCLWGSCDLLVWLSHGWNVAHALSPYCISRILMGASSASREAANSHDMTSRLWAQGKLAKELKDLIGELGLAKFSLGDDDEGGDDAGTGHHPAGFCHIQLVPRVLHGCLLRPTSHCMYSMCSLGGRQPIGVRRQR
jgi:hypothetical protein